MCRVSRLGWGMTVVLAVWGVGWLLWPQAGLAWPQSGGAAPAAGNGSYRELVKRVAPAVVSIEVTKVKNPVPSQRRRFQDDSRRDLDEMEEDVIPRPREPRGRPGQFGSGAIIDPRGVVITNNHVIQGAAEVRVTLYDGRVLTSKQIFGDPKTDLAIIKLEPKSPLPSLEFGASDEMEIGDRVLAFGAPFGLVGSVTSGIISGKSRNLGINIYEDYIQTDAAINPGNSGGPLVNLDGKIIGINTAIRTNTGAFQGVGLAIPSEVARDVAAQLVSTGTVVRGYLGITFGVITPELAQQLGLETPKGALVEEVIPNAPAAKAGLREGDIILTVNGKVLEAPVNLRRMVATYGVGRKMTLGILRDGKRQTVEVTIEVQPSDFFSRREVRPPQEPEGETVSLEKLGLDVADLTPAEAEKLGFTRALRGAVIVQVKKGGLADRAGLKRGMVIVEVNERRVESAAQLRQLVNRASVKEGVALFVRTPKGGDYFTLREGD